MCLKPFQYDRNSLFSARRSVINTPINKIDSSLWTILKDLQIAKTTKRGCRGGKRKERLNVHISSRKSIKRANNNLEKSKVNHHNLQRAPLISTYKPKQQQHLRTKVACWNARSMMNKTTHVCELIISERLDVLAVTESWEKGDRRDEHTKASIKVTLPGYEIYSIPRIGRKGGGICIIYRKELEIKVDAKLDSYKSFEYADILLTSTNQTSFRLTEKPPPLSFSPSFLH